MSVTALQQFLRRVAWRQNVVSFARQGRLFLVVAIGLYALALLLSRLLGLIPAWFTPWTLALPPAVALLFAWVFYRRPHATDAARVADANMGTHDLFLTASVIGSSLGDYQELVLKEAEQRATGTEAGKVVPYHWQRDTMRVCGALALVAVGVCLLPQWDPFGFHQRERKVAEQHKHLQELAKATEVRAALLQQKRAGESVDVAKQAVANLEKTLQGAKPNDKVGTLAKLNEQQKALGQLWKQVSEEKLKNALAVPPAAQSFGVGDPQKAQQLKNDLQKGDVSSAKKELDELKKKAEELAKTTDPVQREKLQQELMDRMQSLKDSMNQQMNSQALDSDLQRAMEQLAMANSPNLSGESLKGMSDSMNLSKAELDALSKAMADMKDVEEALKALQMAKAANGLQPLDGKDFQGLGDLAAYEAICQGKCNGVGNGPNGSGYGVGQRPHGDDSSMSAFNPEKSPSLLQPGRMLMEWKTKEVSEAGPAREEYLRAVQDVRQQASEAVVQEQIPPGYQTAIQKYFDTLHNDAAATPKP
ncbi:MAG TPA: hypothetical protein VKV04_13925 [Verrucomicrobiae bacterium]|nr:hypothetical protein [Verrucomicrobiae bacterium]